MEACRACCAPRFWSGCARGSRRLRPMAACGPAAKWRPGWAAYFGAGGVCRKVAARMAGELGLAEVLPQRGWEALKAIDWSVQKPRPRHPAAATPEEREAFKKRGTRPC